MPVLRVDEGFRDLCSKLADDEYAKLKASIQEEGVRDAVVYWNNGDKILPILDGYNRVKICVDLGIKYPMKGMKLPNRLCSGMLDTPQSAWSPQRDGGPKGSFAQGAGRADRC